MYYPSCGLSAEGNAKSVLYFLSKIPAFILAWFTLLLLSGLIGMIIGIDNMSDMVLIIYALLILIIPTTLTVVLFKNRKNGNPFYQKWWFWLIAFICVFIIFAIVSAPPQLPEETSPSAPTTIDSSGSHETEDITTAATENADTIPIETTSAPLTPRDIFVDSFIVASGLTQESGEAVYDLLQNKLLCSDIEFLQKHETGLYSYDISADGYILAVTVDGGIVYGVSCGSYLMYDDSGVKYTIKDISDRNVDGYEGAYYAIAKSIVEDYLVAPSTAKFASVLECRMQRCGNIGAVQAYVDSQNSFGAMIRNEFVVQFIVLDIDMLTYQLSYIRVGNSEFGEFIDMN